MHHGALERGQLAELRPTARTRATTAFEGICASGLVQYCRPKWNSNTHMKFASKGNAIEGPIIGYAFEIYVDFVARLLRSLTFELVAAVAQTSILCCFTERKS